MTMPAIAEALGMSKRNERKPYEPTKKTGLVERKGARKNGRHVVKFKGGEFKHKFYISLGTYNFAKQ